MCDFGSGTEGSGNGSYERGRKMEEARIKHILFDLDGTLLPMVQEEFVRFYMPLLAKAYIEAGVQVGTGAFIAAVWKGYGAMVANDGSCTNCEAFWRSMDGVLPVSREESERIALGFYADAFNQAACTASPSPFAAEAVRAAKDRGIAVYLATNPVFPRCATMNRIRWAGLCAEDFRIITTYEDCSFCKPNTAYFQGILDRFGLDPRECLMVGNDVEEDLAIRALGVRTFLVTDTVENRHGRPIETDAIESCQSQQSSCHDRAAVTDYMGSLEELVAFIKGLPADR